MTYAICNFNDQLLDIKMLLHSPSFTAPNDMVGAAVTPLLTHFQLLEHRESNILVKPNPTAV